MHRDDGRVRGRIHRLVTEVLRPAVYRETAPLEVSARELRDGPEPFAAVAREPFERFSVGDRWGTPGGTTWFRLTGTVPAGWAGRSTVALVDLGDDGAVGFGAEGLGYDGAGRVLTGLSPRHRSLPVAGPGPVELYVEATANPVSPSGVRAGFATPGPPSPDGLRFRLRTAVLAVPDPELAGLAADLALLAELEAQLAAGEPRKAVLLRGLAEVADRVDPAELTPQVVTAARALLVPLLGVPGGVTALTLHAVGNAHIDTAWLWPYRETRRKAARTLATALRLMAADPEFVFAWSQPQQLEWVREDHPELFERARAATARGQLEPVGAMWVEADGNLPSGESLARQLLVGRQWWSEVLGVAPREVWLPDVFGYPAGLPGLFRHAGLRHFVTQKLSWNERNRIPHHTFWWEGLDGSRVLAHFPPADTYGGDFSAVELLHAQRSFAEAGALDQALYLYGYGDGGGGPTEEMLHAAHRYADLEGAPLVRLSSVGGYLDAVSAELPADLPVWSGELYLEKHRGTYTSQGRLKRANRRQEGLNREAELWSVARGPATYPAAELDRIWRTTLTQQFHDVLPGSGTREVVEDAEAAYAEAATAAHGIVTAALADIAAEVDTGDCRSPVVIFDAGAGAGGVATVPFAVGVERGPGVQLLADGNWGVIAAAPATGWTVLDLAFAPAPTAPARASGLVLGNGILEVRLAADGSIRSVYDAPARREVLAGPANVLQLFRDEPADWDAWDIDEWYDAAPVDAVRTVSVTVVETGPVRAAISVVRRVGSSTVTQQISLAAGSRRVDVFTEVDWRERHRLLKAAFPVAVHAPAAVYEVQWGHVERSLHRNTSWDAARFEACAQRWVSVAETGYGVALLNDGRYGHDVRRLPDGAGTVLRLSLLRSPTWPDPEADQGPHSFSYALLPHLGDLPLVLREATALNLPPRAVPVEPGVGSRPPTGAVVAVSGPAVVEAVKRAVAGPGSVVVRLREAYGGRGPVRLTTGLPVRSWCRADLFERPLGESRSGPVEFDVRPFEIVTLLLHLG